MLFDITTYLLNVDMEGNELYRGESKFVFGRLPPVDLLMFDLLKEHVLLRSAWTFSAK